MSQQFPQPRKFEELFKAYIAIPPLKSKALFQL